MARMSQNNFLSIEILAEKEINKLKNKKLDIININNQSVDLSGTSFIIYRDVNLKINRDSTIDEIVNQYNAKKEAQTNRNVYSDEWWENHWKEEMEIKTKQRESEILMNMLNIIDLKNPRQTLKWILEIFPYTNIEQINVKYRIYKKFKENGYEPNSEQIDKINQSHLKYEDMIILINHFLDNLMNDVELMPYFYNISDQIIILNRNGDRNNATFNN